ncbi:hypothetical protein [uncultured Chryseobacterium sp.]|uniref:hypothetical protein n=1 Tax=uncultured Chryseobacterium sp. TaxID=259322 RepID=UPI0025EE1A4F|nr:hypothetical protein [uncultured Chryseobacterium sp.]
MKSVITFAVLGFAFLSCEKKEISPPADTPDPMEISDKTSAAPMSSDSLPATDTTSAPGNIKSDTTRISR